MFNVKDETGDKEAEKCDQEYQGQSQHPTAGFQHCVDHGVLKIHLILFLLDIYIKAFFGVCLKRSA